MAGPVGCDRRRWLRRWRRRSAPPRAQPRGKSRRRVVRFPGSGYGRCETGRSRRESAPPGWPPRRPPLGSREASDSSASARRDLAPACPAEPKERPELEAQIILEVGHVDEAMDDDSHQGEQHAQLEGPPRRDARTPAAPRDLGRPREDPGKRREPEQTGFRPKVQQDVMRIDQVVGVAAYAAVRVDASGKARESRSKDRMVLQQPEGRLPEPNPLI